MMNGKKAQLTVFIIIGIILLFSSALILYIKNTVTEYKPPVEIAMETVPNEVLPIQKYVTSCLESTLLEAVKKAGMQGGYVDTSSIKINDANPTDAEGISFSPGSDIKIPYWYYMNSPNDCTSCSFATRRLELKRSVGGDSVEQQIDKYIEQKISSCIADFMPFQNQFKIKQSTIKAHTTIAKTEVFVQLTYPLEISSSERSASMSKFTSRVQVNLGKFYDLAKEISQGEAENGVISFMTMNMIDSYSGVNENLLPPPIEYRFECGSPKKWILSSVKSKIEDALMNHIPAFQTTGTLNFKGNLYTQNNDMAKALYNMFIFPINNSYDLNTEFNYLPWWPSYLRITPSKGGMIMPESASGFDAVISFFCMNQYKFSYDLSYPILIQLSEPDALGGEGFNFFFAIETNLRNNAPVTSNQTLLSAISMSSKRTKVCDSENFNSENVIIDVSDSVFDEPVESALVYFSFGKEACFIGETKLENGKATLSSKLPVGIGSLIVSKEGYLSSSVPFGSSLTEAKKVSLKLNKVVDINVTLTIVPFYSDCFYNITDEVWSTAMSAAIKGSFNPINKINPKFQKDTLEEMQREGRVCSWSPVGIEPNLKTTQSAIISLVRSVENNAQESFASSFEMKGNETSKIIRLVPGNYEIIGTLFNNQKTIVPGYEKCEDEDLWQWMGFSKPNCHHIDPIPFDPFVQGGIQINSLNITKEDLKKGNLRIYLISVPDGYNRSSDGMTNLLQSDIQEVGKIEQYSIDYFEIIKPVFS